MHLLPRDEKFFDLLLDQVRLVSTASNLLTNDLGSGAGQPDARATAEKVRELECKGDDAARNIYRLLHKTFITPIDPEDLHELATLIDDVLDGLDGVAYRLDAFGLDRNHERTAELAGMVNRCVTAVVEALECLRGGGLEKPDELSRLCEEINRREFELEIRVREVIRDLFANERDPIQLIKQKEVYELLESTGDRCEAIADVLQAIAVKNS